MNNVDAIARINNGRLHKALSACLNREQNPQNAAVQPYELPAFLVKAINLVPDKIYRFICQGTDGLMFENRANKYTIIISGAIEADGKPWVHLSVCNHRGRTDWDMLRQAKEHFLGRDTYAVSVIPPRANFVDIANVLHCFHCPQGHPLPEFSGFRPDLLPPDQRSL